MVVNRVSHFKDWEGVVESFVEEATPANVQPAKTAQVPIRRSDRLKTVERFVYQYSSDEDQNLIASPDTLTETTANTNAPGVIIQPDDVSLPDNRNIGDSLEVALETKLHPEEPKVTTDYEAEVHLELKESTHEPHAPNRSADLNTTNELFSSAEVNFSRT